MMERKRFTKAVKKVTVVALAAALFFGMMPIKSVFAEDTLTSFSVSTPPTKVTYPYKYEGDLSFAGGKYTISTKTSTGTLAQDPVNIVGDSHLSTDKKPDFTKLGEQEVVLKYYDKNQTPQFLTASYKITVVNYDDLVACYGLGFSSLDPAEDENKVNGKKQGEDGGTITVMKDDKLDLSKCFVRYTKADGSVTDIAITEDKLIGAYDLTKAGTYNLKLSCKYISKDLTEQTKTLSIKLVVSDFKYTAYLQYRAHVQNVGWQATKDEGQMAGTTGKSLRMEALKIDAAVQKPSVKADGSYETDSQGNVKYVNAPEIESPVLYQAHIQNAGWENALTKSNTNFYSGTVGSSLRMEAVKIQLNETLAKGYDVYYRVHIQNKGWTGWFKNGEEAGTTGKSLRLEAIEIRLDKKA